jgi:hypothetical protein
MVGACTVLMLLVVMLTGVVLVVVLGDCGDASTFIFLRGCGDGLATSRGRESFGRPRLGAVFLPTQESPLRAQRRQMGARLSHFVRAFRHGAQLKE